MPLLSITANFSATSGNSCLLQLSSGNGIPTTKLRLKMYHIQLVKGTSATATIPSLVMINLGGIFGGTQIHNVLPLKQGSQSEYLHHSNLSLPITGTSTLQQCNVALEVNQHVPKQLTLSVFKYDGTSGEVVAFPTADPGSGTSSSVRHIQLWFEYGNPNLF